MILEASSYRWRQALILLSILTGPPRRSATEVVVSLEVGRRTVFYLRGAKAGRRKGEPPDRPKGMGSGVRTPQPRRARSATRCAH